MRSVRLTYPLGFFLLLNTYIQAAEVVGSDSEWVSFYGAYTKKIKEKKRRQSIEGIPEGMIEVLNKHFHHKTHSELILLRKSQEKELSKHTQSERSEGHAYFYVSGEGTFEEAKKVLQEEAISLKEISCSKNSAADTTKKRDAQSQKTWRTIEKEDLTLPLKELRKQEKWQGCINLVNSPVLKNLCAQQQDQRYRKLMTGKRFSKTERTKRINSENLQCNKPSIEYMKEGQTAYAHIFIHLKKSQNTSSVTSQKITPHGKGHLKRRRRRKIKSAPVHLGKKRPKKRKQVPTKRQNNISILQAAKHFSPTVLLLGVASVCVGWILEKWKSKKNKHSSRNMTEDL